MPERAQAEILRSASEAQRLTIIPPDWRQIQRYLDPPASTAYPLEFAFHLLGDVRGKSVLDMGCGSGTNLLPLIERGAKVTGLDISPELVSIARKRLDQWRSTNPEPEVFVGSAYETHFPSEMFDVIFCVALLHHLDMPLALAEFRRILKPGGILIVSEPVRFSLIYKTLANWFPRQDADISEYEYPLSEAQLAEITDCFTLDTERYFRLPIVPLWQRAGLPRSEIAYRMSAKSLDWFPGLRGWGTAVVMRLRKESK